MSAADGAISKNAFLKIAWESYLCITRSILLDNRKIGQSRTFFCPTMFLNCSIYCYGSIEYNQQSCYDKAIIIMSSSEPRPRYHHQGKSRNFKSVVVGKFKKQAGASLSLPIEMNSWLMESYWLLLN